MTPKEKAEELVNQYRIILMNEATECGNEILCTSIAKQCGLIAVDEIIEELLECGEVWMKSRIIYWQEIKQKIEKL